MSISANTRLGPYEVIAPLGAGGMGEVWKARDMRLNRSVAIKVLAAEFAQNAQRKLRFEREARAISQLNHPHICTVYDVGHDDGIDYIVMELLEGESLASRLENGPLSLPDVLRYGAEIADALGKAHREGLIHRDLKPGNVMLTKSGAKLLDFGLAKQTAVPPTVDGTTVQKPLTEEGATVGTLHYMAPEQLAGEEADARSDIFALGTVLYEMATGKRAFEGNSRASLIGAIVAGEPKAISEVQPLTPPGLEHVVKKCLSKDPDDRWQSASDVAEELRWIGESRSSGATAAPAQIRRATKQRNIALALALIVTTVALSGAIIWTLRHAETRSVVRFGFDLPEVQPFLAYGLLAVSPDGHQIVYVASDGKVNRLYRRPLDQMESVPIEGTEGASQPFFSPDGKWVGFFARHALRKVALSGGQPIAICRTTNPRGGTWADDGTIVFSPYFYSGLRRVSAAGGVPQRITIVDRKTGESNHRWPHFLPGSNVVLYTVGRGESYDNADIVAQRLDTGERKVIVNGGCDGRYVPPGYLVYVRGTSLYAISFDPKRLAVRGQPVEVLKGVANNAAGAGEFAFTGKGLLVYLPAGEAPEEGGPITIVNRHGERQDASMLLPKESLQQPRLSADDSKLAARLFGGEIWIFDLRRGGSTRLTMGRRSINPVWSPDGKRVAYGSERNGPWDAYWRAADGSDEERLLAASDSALIPCSFSPDGKQLLVIVFREATGTDIGAISVVDGHLRSVVQTGNNEASPVPVFSPDGKWIAYQSDESGVLEIYVQSASGSAGRWQISTGGGTGPSWRHDGEIFYKHGAKLMSVSVRTEPQFSAGSPQVLFERPFRGFDVTRDGQLFFLVQQRETSAERHIDVVVNWFDDAEARMRGEVPAK